MSTPTTRIRPNVVEILTALEVAGQDAVAFKANDTSTTTNSNHCPIVFNMDINATLKGPVAFALNGSDPGEDQIHFNIVANRLMETLHCLILLQVEVCIVRDVT